MAQFQFDASKVAPMGEYEVYPEGWYTAFISASVVKEAKSKSNYLALDWKLQECDFQGGSVSNNLNLWNANEKAREIAFRELSSICHATGVMQLQDTAQLHQIPIKIRLAVREGERKDDGSYYGDQNDIKGYKAYNEPTPATPTRADQIAMQERSAKRDVERKNSPAQAQAPAAGAWQPPAQQAAPAGQPAWAAPAQQAPQQPVQQATPQQAPQQQAPQQPAPVQPQAAGTPPWAQTQVPNGQQAAAQIQQQAPAQAQQPAQQAAPAAAGAPPWAQAAAPGGTPPWAQAPQQG